MNNNGTAQIRRIYKNCDNSKGSNVGGERSTWKCSNSIDDSRSRTGFRVRKTQPSLSDENRLVNGEEDDDEEMTVIGGIVPDIFQRKADAAKRKNINNKANERLFRYYNWFMFLRHQFMSFLRREVVSFDLNVLHRWKDGKVYAKAFLLILVLSILLYCQISSNERFEPTQKHTTLSQKLASKYRTKGHRQQNKASLLKMPSDSNQESKDPNSFKSSEIVREQKTVNNLDVENEVETITNYSIGKTHFGQEVTTQYSGEKYRATTAAENDFSEQNRQEKKSRDESIQSSEEIITNIITANMTTYNAGKTEDVIAEKSSFAINTEKSGLIPLDSKASLLGKSATKLNKIVRKRLINTKKRPFGERPVVKILNKKPATLSTKKMEKLEMVTKFLDPRLDTDIPVFWNVPKGGGAVIKDVLSVCMDFTLALRSPSSGESSLDVVTIDGSRFVNVDTTSLRGIEKAKELDLAGSGIVDVIVTPHIRQVSIIFDNSHKARLFTMLQDPIIRAISLFEYRKSAKSEPTWDPKLETMTIAEYAKTDMVENNWMTRILSGQYEGEMTQDNLKEAKRFLRETFLVGLVEKQEESWSRVQHYFGFETDNKKSTSCIEGFIGKQNDDAKVQNSVNEGSDTYNFLLWQNKYDMKIYKYATKLFEQQGNYLNYQT